MPPRMAALGGAQGHMPITWLDIVVLAFMLISALLAMARGFTRELLSILSWVAAALVTLWAFPRYQG